MAQRGGRSCSSTPWDDCFACLFFHAVLDGPAHSQGRMFCAENFLGVIGVIDDVV